MTTEQFDWSTITQAFTLGAFPWITQFKKLEIHLVLTGMRTRTVNNFFASLFAMSVFVVVTYSHPYEVIDFPPWWIFITSAFLLSIVFVAAYVYFKDKRSLKHYKLVIMAQFIVYIFLFSLLTMGFGQLKLYRNYYVFKGQVIDKVTNEGHRCTVLIADGLSTVLKMDTDNDGRFNLLINNEDFPEGLGINLSQCERIEAYSATHEKGEALLYRNFSAISLIKRIEINPKK